MVHQYKVGDWVVYAKTHLDFWSPLKDLSSPELFGVVKEVVYEEWVRVSWYCVDTLEHVITHNNHVDEVAPYDPSRRP